MPFYDFTCTDCKHTFTVRTSFSEKQNVICPECHSNHLKERYQGYGGGSTKTSAIAPAAPRSPFR